VRYCVAKNATIRTVRPDPSLRKKRLFRMTIKLSHYYKPHGRGRPRLHLLDQSGQQCSPARQFRNNDEFMRGVGAFADAAEAV
jgi:hypothetical protein